MHRTILLLTTAFTMFSVPLFAYAANDEFCTNLGLAAKGVMMARQSGASMSEIMSMAEKTGPASAPLLRAVVVMAYDEPQFTTPQMRDQSVKKFSNSVQLSCYKKQAGMALN